VRGRIRGIGLFACLLLSSGLVPAHAAARTPECQGGWIPATPVSSDIMNGELDFLDLPSVKIKDNVDWRLNPYKNRSWQMVYHSLRWMARLVADYESTGKTSYLNRAVEVAKDWVADNPRGGRRTSPYAWAEHPIALRAPALVCLSKHVSGKWLTDSLALHAKLLADPRTYEAGHNHGFDQDIGLLAIGCRFDRKSWQDLALRRMVRSAKLDIDSEGSLREQAPRYAIYVYDKLKIALDTIADCGRKAPADLRKRWEGLPRHIAAATQPNGYMVPVGDGAADVQPAGYPHPKATVQVFKAGYVFGRTAWNDADSAYYSIRYGPGLKFHGHEDHLGVTYFAQGRNVLTEAGFHSYENTPYRRWTITPEAHNVPVVVGRRFRGHTASALTRRSVGADRQSFTVTDTAYGVRRTRAVLVSHRKDVMAVLDTAGSKLRNLWHFPPALKVTAAGGGRVVASDGAWKAALVQLSASSCKPISGQRVVRGQTSPYQGWVSPGYMRKESAAAVISPAAKGILTIIVPGADDPRVTCSGHTVIVHAPNGPVTFKISGSNLG
jgi:hypothetical protein